MSEPEAQPVDEDGELILPPEDDEPEAMTGSAVRDPVGEVLGEPDEEPESAAIHPGPGFPITIDLDAQGNGSTHVGVFQRDIVSVDIDGIPAECLYVGDHPSAVGIAVIEVRGAPTRLKPVSGIVITK